MNKLDEFFEAIEKDRESMRERIREYTKDELLSLADDVVNYKYYGGPELSLGHIMKKHKGLAEIIDSAPGCDYAEWEEYRQAQFIILNAIREYYISKGKDV
jgi:hypothetical protein